MTKIIHKVQVYFGQSNPGEMQIVNGTKQELKITKRQISKEIEEFQVIMKNLTIKIINTTLV